MLYRLSALRLIIIIMCDSAWCALGWGKSFSFYSYQFEMRWNMKRNWDKEQRPKKKKNYVNCVESTCSPYILTRKRNNADAMMEQPFTPAPIAGRQFEEVEKDKTEANKNLKIEIKTWFSRLSLWNPISLTEHTFALHTYDVRKRPCGFPLHSVAECICIFVAWKQISCRSCWSRYSIFMLMRTSWTMCSNRRESFFCCRLFFLFCFSDLI